MSKTASVMLGIMTIQALNGYLLYPSQCLMIQTSGSISSWEILVERSWDNPSNNATVIINFVTQFKIINVDTYKDINLQAKVMYSYLSVKWKYHFGKKLLSIL